MYEKWKYKSIISGAGSEDTCSAHGQPEFDPQNSGALNAEPSVNPERYWVLPKTKQSVSQRVAMETKLTYINTDLDNTLVCSEYLYYSLLIVIIITCFGNMSMLAIFIYFISVILTQKFGEKLNCKEPN